MKIVKKLSLFVVILFMASCASRKDIIYLQDLNLNEGHSSVEIADSVFFKMPTFKPDDRLTINISSINPEAARPFNLYITSFNMGGITSAGQQQQQSYLVDKDGYISFPQLGELKVLGMNRIELQKVLEKKLKMFLPDVIANVQLVNFRISMLGEVTKPGEYIINRDKVSILQAIGMAGDLTIHGKRDNIKLIREVNGLVKYYDLDLRSKDVVNSPAYFLQQNDVVYVAPNKPQVNASASSPTASYIISATGLLITIISILTR
ncbi:hypothetical protein AXE80_01140 [Wenyingzhuangia fucanilytica]|uniref:Sugar transporter n=1 Tax=Wenyingzhuangia fucanilytica TaxID=1790137 RepID=A0A1B1Y2K0_9FLAO|nr:polysaccharide biosynthesis/export family protein [Wenyingzhuangia fucanilytica]ANW94980.1 hypothetical protein AXE80_01140 [Wenyingzhuangia fucanilytica]